MKNDTKTHATNPADNAPAQHTPGPWHTNVDCGVLSESGLHICDVNGYGATSETKRANAELIASAPRLKRERDELLAACRFALKLAQSRIQEIDPRNDMPRGENPNLSAARHNAHVFYSLIARIEKGGAS